MGSSQGQRAAAGRARARSPQGQAQGPRGPASAKRLYLNRTSKFDGLSRPKTKELQVAYHVSDADGLNFMLGSRRREYDTWCQWASSIDVNPSLSSRSRIYIRPHERRRAAPRCHAALAVVHCLTHAAARSPNRSPPSHARSSRLPLAPPRASPTLCS